MKAKVVIPREQANRDADDAVAYYLSEVDEAVAIGFVDALERAYGHISRPPGHRLSVLRPCTHSARPARIAADALPAPRVLRRALRPRRCVACAARLAEYSGMDARARTRLKPSGAFLNGKSGCQRRRASIPSDAERGFAGNAVAEKINALIEQRCALTMRGLTAPAI